MFHAQKSSNSTVFFASFIGQLGPDETLEDVDVAVSLFGPISYVDPDLVFQLVSSGVTKLYLGSVFLL